MVLLKLQEIEPKNLVGSKVGSISEKREAMRNDFTLFKRVIGKTTVYYYYAYDADGRRRKYSTGKTTKTAAAAYCLSLAKTGNLIPAEKDSTLFRNLAADIWNVEKSPYLRAAALRGRTLARQTIYNREQITQRRILPYFGDMKIRNITRREIEKWMLGLSEQGFMPGSVNQAKITLNLIMEYAVDLGLIASNPCKVVKPFADHPKERGILTLEETREIFLPENISRLWNNNRISYAANLLAAVTGMRLNEVRALRREDIKEGYLVISHSIYKNGLKDTKNHKTREIPIPQAAQDMLLSICPICGGFVFSCDGKTPLPLYQFVIGGLYKALAAMGISEEERQRRNICFHSWRHFFNTTLRASGISDSKTQAITGHSSIEMTDRYTHFSHTELKEINQVQAGILGA